jgi:hypothetical protein
MQRYMALLRQQGALLLLEQEEREERARKAAAAGTVQGVPPDAARLAEQGYSAADGTAAVHTSPGGGISHSKLYNSSKDGQQQDDESPAVNGMAGQYITLPLWPDGPVPASNPHLGPGRPHPELLEHLADRQAKSGAAAEPTAGSGWYGGSQPGTLPLGPDGVQKQQQQQGQGAQALEAAQPPSASTQGHMPQQPHGASGPQARAPGAQHGSTQQAELQPLQQHQQQEQSPQSQPPAPPGATYAFGENKAVQRLHQVPYWDAPPWPPPGAALPPWHPSYLAQAPQGPWTEHLHVKPQVLVGNGYKARLLVT